MELHEKLIDLRKEKGLSQMEVAEELNVTRQAVSRWETGASIPSTDNLICLGKLFDVPVEHFFREIENESVTETECLSEKDGSVITDTSERARSWNVTRILLCVCALLLVMTISVCIAVIHRTEKTNNVSPVEELEIGDITPNGSFSIGW